MRVCGREETERMIAGTLWTGLTSGGRKSGPGSALVEGRGLWCEVNEVIEEGVVIVIELLGLL